MLVLFEASVFIFLLTFNIATIKFQCVATGAKATELTHIHFRNIISCNTHTHVHTHVCQRKAYLRAPLSLWCIKTNPSPSHLSSPTQSFLSQNAHPPLSTEEGPGK